MSETKQFTCDICNTEKTSKNFRRFQTICIECETDPNKEILKTCTVCGVAKEVSAFPYNQIKCKACCSEQRKVSNKIQRCICCLEEKQKIFFRRGQHACKVCEENPSSVYDKKCGFCNQIKSSTRFRVNRKKCIDCEQEYGRNYNKSTDTRKKWVENNRERMNELQRNHYEAHKTEIRAKQSEKFQTDPDYRLCKAYRKTISNLIRGTTNKNTRLGMNREQYIAWIEFCFTENMNIENHNIFWQVDHVIPLISVKTKKLGTVTFDEEDTMEYVYRWYNTTPLTCKDNHIKNKHVDKKLMAKHLNNLASFLNKNQKSLGITVDDEEYNVYKINMKFIMDNS